MAELCGKGGRSMNPFLILIQRVKEIQEDHTVHGKIYI
jgi:hypothetical protein